MSFTAFARPGRILAALSLLMTLPLAPAFAQGTPAHLAWGQKLVAEALPQNNAYGSSPSYIHFKGIDGYAVTENRTVCATFVTALYQRAYGWNGTTFQTWMGSTSPNAALYHDTIAAGTGFWVVSKVTDILPGDVIAVKYPAGSDSSGHAMLAETVPVVRTASSPLVNGTTQYEVTVLDSSESGHGPTDTRLHSNGTWGNGAGRGVLRLYADSQGLITGYTWSTYSNSAYYAQNVRNLVVGRLK
jgi:hypothetical protein